MAVTLLDTETADRDLTSLVTVLTDTPDATNAMLCQGLIVFGDGTKDLDGSGGTFDFVITVNGQTVQPSPQGIVFGTEVRSSAWTSIFPVPAGEEVVLRVKSPNGADTDVAVTAYLYDIHTYASADVENPPSVNATMTKTVTRNWKIEGVLTDVTSAKLSDPTGTYGVKRNDTDGVVVADGTAMTKESTGVYSYTFDEPVEGLSYTAYVEFVYGGATYHFEHDIPAAAATETLTITYETLRREIGRAFGFGHSPDDWEDDATVVADIGDVLRSGVRRVLTPPPLPDEKYAHEWSFLRPADSFTTTAPYTTGTVEIASGVATITDGSWPSWATQGALTISSGTYTVASVDGDDLTLTDTSVDADAGTTFSLGRVAYDMPSDFADIEGPLIYAAGQSLLQSPIGRISEYELLRLLCFELLSGYPRKYALRPKPIDMTAATAYEMLLSPTPDAAYTLYYHYRVAIPPLDNSNEIPPGGDAHGELYLQACLAAGEEKFHDGPGQYAQRFLDCLVASVSHDRRVACPDTQGFNRDPSDEMAAFDPEDHYYTDTGVVQYNGYPP